MHRLLGLSDSIVNCWNEDLRFHFNFHSHYEYLHNKLLCLYEIDTDLLVYRTSVSSQNMWIQPNTNKMHVNGFIVRIYDAPHDYYSNLHDHDFTTDASLLFEKKFPMKKAMKLVNQTMTKILNMLLRIILEADNLRMIVLIIFIMNWLKDILVMMTMKGISKS